MVNAAEKLNILFVDDEPLILEGLRNRLRKYRKRWNTHFVTSGQEALELLNESPMDVVVSDMRMPQMDGAALLSEVQRLHGDAIRIVLSGHAELEEAMRVMPVAHQFLTKPCDANQLEDIIDRACNLQRLLKNEELQAIVTGIDNLPAVPCTYHRLVVAIADEHSSAKDLAQIIREDIGICAKVLRVANSSFFSRSRNISDIEAAVVRLGSQTIKSLVMGMEVFTLPKGVEVEFSMQGLQERSLACASLAKRLSSPEYQELAFLSGMLHDMGQLVLATYQPKLYSRAVVLAREHDVPQHEAEETYLGVSHAEVGAYLLGLWGLPYPVIEAVAFHHRPDRVETENAGVYSSVHLASELVSDQCRLNHEVLDRLGLEYSNKELQDFRDEFAHFPTKIQFRGAA